MYLTVANNPNAPPRAHWSSSAITVCRYGVISTNYSEPFELHDNRVAHAHRSQFGDIANCLCGMAAIESEIERKEALLYAQMHAGHDVIVVDSANMTVRMAAQTFRVNIMSGNCSCQKPSLDSVICRHVWSALLCQVDGGDTLLQNRLCQFAAKGTLKCELQQLYTYDSLAEIVCSKPKNYKWRDLKPTDLKPAPEPRTQGRPAQQSNVQRRLRRNERRIRSNGERNEIRCSRCLGTRHNRRTCTYVPAQSPNDD